MIGLFQLLIYRESAQMGELTAKKQKLCMYKQYLYQIPSIGGQCHRLLVPQFKHCMKADLIPEPTVIYIQLTHSAE